VEESDTTLESSGRKLGSPESLNYWINQREVIRYRKENGYPKPWSSDPVFQTTYFCNVRREDDRVTRWLRSNWLVDDMNYEFAMVLARLVNRPATLELIGYPYDGQYLDYILEAVRNAASRCVQNATPFWGNAYVVTTHGQPIDKLSYLIGLLEGAHKVLPLAGVAPTCSAYHAAFKTLEGFSDFMAAQIVADLKNTAFHPLANAPDWHSFVAPGPGSLRGMSWFFSRKVTTRGFQENIAEIRRVLEGMGNKIIPTICNQDLQNCLCEFDKYMRVFSGTGRSKRKYPGAAEQKEI
jgi:hypothetical protein